MKVLNAQPLKAVHSSSRYKSFGFSLTWSAAASLTSRTGQTWREWDLTTCQTPAAWQRLRVAARTSSKPKTTRRHWRGSTRRYWHCQFGNVARQICKIPTIPPQLTTCFFSNRLLFFCGSKLIQDYSYNQRENLTWNSHIGCRVSLESSQRGKLLVTIPETLPGLSDDSQGTNFFQRCRCGWHRCGSCCPAIDRWVVTNSSHQNPTS